MAVALLVVVTLVELDMVDDIVNGELVAGSMDERALIGIFETPRTK